MSGCGDFSVRLPGNYSLVRVYAGAVLISGPSNVVVIDSNINSYKVLGHLVVGQVNSPGHFSPEEKAVSKPGYFILNTKTHEVRQGLDKKSWLDALQMLGVRNEPELGTPSRFDRLFE